MGMVRKVMGKLQLLRPLGTELVMPARRRPPADGLGNRKKIKKMEKEVLAVLVPQRAAQLQRFYNRAVLLLLLLLLPLLQLLKPSQPQQLAALLPLLQRLEMHLACAQEANSSPAGAKCGTTASHG